VSTTYLSSGALERLDQAQAVMDRHGKSTAAGHCLACGQQEPCVARRTAESTFTRYGRLPRRTPGLSVPVDLGAPNFGWFAGWDRRQNS
jgi:hypothetical protein